MIGRRLGRYLVLAPLGRGGMASVWRARDELLGREVALKVLAETLRDSPEARRRFRHEAEIAALLDHPGVAPVYDAGEDGGDAWLAMALVDGESVTDLVARALPPVDEAVRIVCAAADALGYAHARGVIHRDVTGRNVMRARDGRVVVLDFGLALAQGRSRITSSHTTIGTLSYMAPEQVRGEAADARSDLFGLGCVAYELLTGAPPFAGGTAETLTYAALNRDPDPPRARRPETPVALERVVLRLLARDPAARHTHAGALVEDLRALAPGPGAAAPPAPEPPPRPWVGPGDRGAPVYLLVPPVAEVGPDSGAAPAGLASDLTRAARDALARLHRLHVVVTGEPTPGDAGPGVRDFVRSHGASLLLHSTLRVAGTRARVDGSVLDPERGLQVAGVSVDGSVLEPFDLEDRFGAALRGALGLGDRAADGPAPSPAPDPAAGEHYAQAVRYLERHDLEASVDGAIAILERLVEGEDGRAEYHAALARACVRKHELTRQGVWEGRAAGAAERARALDPDAAGTLVALGDVHALAGRRDEAEREYRRAAERRPESAEAWLGVARMLQDRGDCDGAARACQRAIMARPGDWRGYSRLGQLYFERGLYAEALEPWRRVVELTPDNAKAARNLGSAFYHMDRLDEAVGEFRRSLDLQPNAVAHSNLGTVLYYLGRHGEASEAFEKAVALRPSDALMWGNLGNALRHCPGGESRAREALERAVGLARERHGRGHATPESRARLATWLSNLGLREDALREIAAATESGPDNVHVMKLAACVALESGRREEGLLGLERAVRHGYGVEVLRRDPDLEALRDDPAFRRILEIRTAANDAACVEDPHLGGRGP